MFLKRLTMKGFKSFADTTTLEFEPGVTAVVGPNGSGKSNVVDAVTWVLGAQSTRALRSARMEDVIFVGTASRPALGRAEVALTLDNGSGKLPIDGAEVTISRTLFRSGESEYAINGTPCRLLDVQELLGDSGVGRQQHMIIGQGQLDSVLNARPEERRAVIEEAAGVLKHRRRKERAERRLTQTQENLERLGDLVREVRRQMRPLERQAAAARSHADVESELRHVRRFALATALDENARRRRELDERLRGASQRERELRHELVTLDAQATAAAAEVASRREELLASTLGVLQGLSERARGLTGVITERRRAVRAALAASADENVIATLEADAAKLAVDLEATTADEAAIAASRQEAVEAQERLADAERQFDATWGSALDGTEEADVRAAAQATELLERSVAEAQRQLERATQRAAAAAERQGTLSQRQGAANLELATAREHASSAQEELAALRTAADEAEETLERAATSWRESAEAAAHASARAEALARALAELSGASASQVVAELEGVIGPLLELVDVDPGAERAVEAAAGAAAGAVVVDGRHSAQGALEALRVRGDAGAVLPVSEAAVATPTPPDGCEPLRDLVRPRRGAPAHVGRVLDALFARAFVAPTFEAALDLAATRPDLVIVTRAGDRLAASGWRVASGRGVVTRTAVEEATQLAAAAAAAVPATQRARDEAAERAREARRGVEAALAIARAADTAVDRLLAELEELGRRFDVAAADATAAQLECETAEALCAQLTNELADARATLAACEVRLSEVAERAAWAHEARATLDAHRAQVAELDRALARREAEHAERLRLLESRRREVEARLEGHSAERQAAAGRRERLEGDLRALDRLEALVERASGDIKVCQDALGETYREQLESSRAGAERLEELRRLRGMAEARLSELSESARHDEIESAELAVRRGNLEDDVRRYLGEEPEDVNGATPPELAEGVTVVQRLAELEARISSLGPINPLALEELAALEDRYKDLDAQVSDVRHARRELQEVVRALDEEIMTTFSSAVADVNEHFSTLIAMLFPGGQGRLLLTAPDDPLNTGVEIEVRPMGRNVRRISLLSGGERSMAALAFLFAVFRSRPSPFYMMDEVEAALDDVNLQRFLSLVDEFRDEAQLLIVTHQKRTMESADALYGVTMAPGGSSKVVSQRVRRTEDERS